MNKLVFGFGVNDAYYAVNKRVNGKRSVCHFYRAWCNMLARFYSASLKEERPTYIGCSVCEEWLIFSNFKTWMEKQDWQGKHLDKDILFKGNKVYSPDTCVFISGKLNNFTNEHASARGNYPLGASLHASNGKFQSSCNNPLTKKLEYLGLFSCPQQAHQAWRKRKHEISCQLADMQTDERVAAALRVRYL